MRRRLSSAAFALAFLSANPAIGLSAQDQAQNSGALFLLFPVGARTVGMGQAVVALDGRGEAVFGNPAGVADLEHSEFGLHTGQTTAGSANALSAFFPEHRIGVFGASLYLLDYGNLDLTDSGGTVIGRVSPRNFEALATYATQLTGTFAIGVSYKLVEFRVDCSGDCRLRPPGQGVTHALDLGGQFSVGPDHALRIGVAVRNVGFALQVNNRDQADPLPTRLVIGALYRVNLRPFEGGTDLDRFDVRVAADVDSPWRETGNPDVRVGVDVGYRELLRVRGGYAFVHEGLSGPSLGLGLTSGSIGVDLARTFLTGTELLVPNPTYVSFRVVF